MITVIGSANMDLIAQVSRLPAPGETVLASNFARLPGGKGANQAVAAARAGSDVIFVGRVGRDAYGDDLLTNLQNAGVNTEHVIRDPDFPTGMALIAVDAAGENSIVVVPGANSRVSTADVDRAANAIAASRVIVLQLEIPLETVSYAARRPRGTDSIVLLNPAPARALPADLLRSVDLLVPNQEEVARLSGLGRPAEPATAARLLLSAGAAAMVVTMGAAGVLVITPERDIGIPAFPAVPVDTTGAGDAFVGNLAHALDSGLGLEEAARFASAAAALSVEKPGAQPSMPSASETEALLQAGAGP